MGDFGIGEIISLVAAAASSTVGGLQAAGTFTHPGPSAQSIATAENQANQKTQQAQEQQAFKHFAPDAQSQTGGSLSDQSFSALIAQLAGSPSDINLAHDTVFGGGGGGGGATSPTMPTSGSTTGLASGLNLEG